MHRVETAMLAQPDPELRYFPLNHSGVLWSSGCCSAEYLKCHTTLLCHLSPANRPVVGVSCDELLSSANGYRLPKNARTGFSRRGSGIHTELVLAFHSSRFRWWYEPRNWTAFRSSRSAKDADPEIPIPKEAKAEYAEPQ